MDYKLNVPAKILPITFFFWLTACSLDRAEPSMVKLLTADSGWQVLAVTENGNRTQEFDGMKIQFSPTDYSTSIIGNEIWPATGEYSLDDHSSAILIRNDGTEIFISSIDDECLVMDFSFHGIEPVSGRSHVRIFRFSFQSPH